MKFIKTLLAAVRAMAGSTQAAQVGKPCRGQVKVGKGSQVVHAANVGDVIGKNIVHNHYASQTLTDWDSDSLKQEKARCQEKCRRMAKERKQSAPYVLFWAGMLGVALAAWYFTSQLICGLDCWSATSMTRWAPVGAVAMVAASSYWLARRDRAHEYGAMMQMYALRIQMINMVLRDRK